MIVFLIHNYGSCKRREKRPNYGLVDVLLKLVSEKCYLLNKKFCCYEDCLYHSNYSSRQKLLERYKLLCKEGVRGHRLHGLLYLWVQENNAKDVVL